jgi:hypothetical protein
MSALAEVFDDIIAADITIIVKGDSVKVQAHTAPSPDLVTRLRDAKPNIIAMHHAYIERLHDYARRYDHEVASRMAYNVTISTWHLDYGHMPVRTHCAGCGRQLDHQQQIMVLLDGANLHDSDACLVAWGETWRTAASGALQRLGIHKPATWEV